MGLSRREQQILAAIENELSENDRALTARFTTAGFRRRVPFSPGHTVALVLALVALIVLHSAALELGVVGLGVLTFALIVPWLVSAARPR